MPEFFKVLKINPTTRTGSWSDLAAAMEDGALDALAVGAGVPFPEFAMLGRRDKVRYLPLTASQVVTLRIAIPELGASVVPAGTGPQPPQLAASSRLGGLMWWTAPAPGNEVP
jgi:uncharacterized protein